MVSNRSLIQSFFVDKKPNGSIIFNQTSTGNKELETKYAKEIGKDVIAVAYIVSLQVKPVTNAEGEITACYCVMMINIDVGGTLPDFVKKAIGEAQCKGLDDMVNYIKKTYKA